MTAACFVATAATPLFATSFTVTVNDTFNNNDPIVGTNLTGRTPQVLNVATGVWQKYGTQPDGAITADGGRSVARARADNGYRIAYVTRTGMVSRAEIMVTSTFRYYHQGWSDFFRGVGVGFSDSDGTPTAGIGYFTGLALGPKSDTDTTLNLKLINNTGAGAGGFVVQTPYTGSLTNPGDYHTLAYVVNLLSNAITRIELDGDAYSFTNAVFTERNTRNFSFQCTGTDAEDYGCFDSVQVAGATVARNVAVSDSFTDSDPTVGTALAGRTPQVANQTGGDVWHKFGSFADTPITSDGGRNIAKPSADLGYRICITNTGLAPQRKQMTVTTRLRYSGGGYSDFYRGVGVGFYSSGTPTAGIGYFRGLALGPASAVDTTLNLKLINNTAAGTGGFVSQTPYTGTRTAASDYHDLTYTVDTVSGGITSIELDGQSYSFSTTAFTAANTGYFGFYNCGPFGVEYGWIDSVELSIAVPPRGTIFCIH